jgi:hypothetical protein
VGRPALSVAVVYLKWKPLGVGLVHDFFDSYLEHPSGMNHDLIVHEEGYEGDQDIAKYFRVAESVRHEHLLFMNTETYIKEDNWLDKMMSHSAMGLVGAFGSWECCPNGNTTFPNPHIRTNCFLVSRELFLAYPTRPVTKNQCYDFESGPRSFTRFVQGQKWAGVSLVDQPWVVSGSWNKAGFRVGNQEGLLFSDRQSRHYDGASPEERARLAELAWGKP